MTWKIQRGRHGADPLEPEEIEKFQAAPETAADPSLAAAAPAARQPTMAGNSQKAANRASRGRGANRAEGGAS